MTNTNILRIAVLTGLILIIPLIAMQITNEVDWNLADFMVMGTLLFGSGLAYELIAKHSVITVYRAGVGLALLATFLLVWVNGAVGIIGDGPINLLYSSVPAVLILGAAASRLKPQGMALALIATAIVQALIPVIALILLVPDFRPGVLKVFVLNGFFVMMFAGSALLFRRAKFQYE